MYKYGRGLANREERFATPNIKWLGVWTSEVSRQVILWSRVVPDPYIYIYCDPRINSDNLLPLTEHDVKKVKTPLRD